MATYRTIKPSSPGQKPIRFKQGALTAQAKRAGMSIDQLCRTSSSPLVAKRCNFMKNVLRGKK